MQQPHAAICARQPPDLVDRASVESSSAKMTSQATPERTLRRRSTSGAILSRSLRVGTIRVSSAPDATDLPVSITTCSVPSAKSLSWPRSGRCSSPAHPGSSRRERHRDCARSPSRHVNTVEAAARDRGCRPACNRIALSTIAKERNDGCTRRSFAGTGRRCNAPRSGRCGRPDPRPLRLPSRRAEFGTARRMVGTGRTGWRLLRNLRIDVPRAASAGCPDGPPVDPRPPASPKYSRTGDQGL